MQIRRATLTIVAVTLLIVAGCGQTNGHYTVSVPPQLRPRLAPDDVVRISRTYLDAQASQIIDPEMHIPPTITAVWAVRADDAATLDACIPPNQGDAIVWVTKGHGDYLNLADHAWSLSTLHASFRGDSAMTCADPGTDGTLVIDDASGTLLGVYPASPIAPHQSP